MSLTDIYSFNERRHTFFTETRTINAGATHTATYNLGNVTGEMIVMVGATYTTDTNNPPPSSPPSFTLWEQRGSAFYPLVSATLNANVTNVGGSSGTVGYHFSTPNRLFYSGQPVRIGIQNSDRQGNFRVTIAVIR